MSEPPGSDDRDYRHAEEQLGGRKEQVVEPVEDTPAMAAAVEDDTALTDLGTSEADNDDTERPSKTP